MRKLILLGGMWGSLSSPLQAVGDSANQSDFRFRIGSVSVSNTTLRSRFNGNLPEATPRPVVSFTIQQNGFAPTVTNVPIHYRYTSNSTGVSYTVPRASQNIMGTTNSSVQRSEELIPPSALPFGSYTLRILLDKDSEICDRNRSNNTVVVTSSLNYVPTPSFRIFEFDVAGHSFLGGSNGTLKRFAAGETITLNYGISNIGESLPTAVPMRVNFYLTTLRPTSQQRFRGLPSRTILFRDPDLRFLGWDMGFTGDGNSVSFTMPADLDNLKYSVAAIANPDLAVPERSPGTATPIGFQLEEPFEILYVYNRPDLFPSSSVSLSSTDLTTSDSLQIISAVQNTGNQPSQGTIMHHYLQQVLPSGSSSVRYLLGTSTVPPLPQAPLPSAPVFEFYDVTFEIPDNVPSGDYTYLRVVDEIDVVLEREEFNESNFSPVITITRSPLPNLFPSPDDPFTSTTATSAEAGDTFTVSALIQNFDSPATNSPDGPAPSFPVRFFLQPLAGSNPELQRVVLGTVNSVGTTAVGANKALSLTTSLPSVNAGSYRLGYEIDPNETVPERFRTDNTSLNPVSDIFQVLPTVPQLPDLIVTKITPDALFNSYGKQMRVEVVVANVGSGDANPSQLRLSLSPDAIADNNDAILVINTTVPAIDSGEEATVQVEVTLPSEDQDSLLGSFYWVTEVGRNLVESDETNNFEVLTDSLLKLSSSDESLWPLIEVDSNGVSPTLTSPGKFATSFVEIINEGFFGASQVEVDVYLSPAGSFNPASDPLLHSFPPFDLPGSGGFQSLTREIEIPADTPPGNYQVVWSVDPEFRIPRVNEDTLIESHPIAIRALALRVELLQRTEEFDLIAIFDTDQKRKYALFTTENLAEQELEEMFTFEGSPDGPVVIELENNDRGELLRSRFFQVIEN